MCILWCCYAEVTVVRTQKLKAAFWNVTYFIYLGLGQFKRLADFAHERILVTPLLADAAETVRNALAREFPWRWGGWGVVSFKVTVFLRDTGGN